MRAVCGHTFPHQVLAERVDFLDLRTREAQGVSALGQQQCGLRVIRMLTAESLSFILRIIGPKQSLEHSHVT